MYSRPELAGQVAQLVREGNIFELGHPLEPGIPHHPNHPPFLFSIARMHGDLGWKVPYSGSNDIFTAGGHTGTHLDAIGHIACDGRVHGGLQAEAVQDKLRGLSVHSIDQVEPIIRRGILLDVAAARGETVLPAGYEVTPSDLEAAVNYAGIQLQKGDAVLIRTGWSRYWPNPRQFASPEAGTPGIGVPGAKWLVERGMGLAGGDTLAFEVTPSGLPVHVYLLVEQGIQIMECLNLEELSEARCYEFLFICLPLRIKGGTGSPIRPIAVS